MDPNSIALPESVNNLVTRYYTPAEVALHNTPDDIWVSYNGTVYNLTPLMKQKDMLPILKNAGRDISHWFNGMEFKQKIDKLTGQRIAFCPDGLPPSLPCTVNVPNNFSFELEEWWKSNGYQVGILTKKVRKVRIVNTLTQEESIIQFCGEESISEIQKRYQNINAHADGYTWKYLGNVLNMSGTMEENNIEDDQEEMISLGMNPNDWLPAIMLYFSDNLTIK